MRLDHVAGVIVNANHSMMGRDAACVKLLAWPFYAILHGITAFSS